MRLLRSHGEGTRHHHELATGTHRLDTLQAAILEVKLRHLADWNQRRRDAAAALRDGLAGSGVIAARPGGDRQRPRLPPLRRPQRQSATPCATTSTPRGVASAIHYPTPIHLQPAYAELGLGPGSLPVAERLATENCSLPIFPAIEDWQIAEIVAAVQSFEVASR